MPVAFNREAYNPISENPFLATRTNPLSTFFIGLDAAFYSNMRRYIMDSQIPPRSM
jgi:Ca-activated chloride channel family protein